MAIRTLVQLTDTHLFSSAHGRLIGVNTAESLDAVLETVRANGHDRPDAVLVTGDISQDRTPESYERFRKAVAGFSCPVFCLPGNHDAPADLLRYTAEPVRTEKEATLGRWHLILLDSTIPGESGGGLSPAEMDFLKRALDRSPSDFFLIALHHHPCPSGSRWMDEMMVRNRDAFLSLLHERPNVRVVLCGHVHQELAVKGPHWTLYGAPSTCVQFAPKSDGFAVDLRAPGYRWLELSDNGTVATAVHRAEKFPITVDRAATGY